MFRIFMLLSLLVGLGLPMAFAQTQPQLDSRLFDNNRLGQRNDPVTFNPEWAPFFHGVASGDPLEDRVIIWTRVTPEDMNNDPIDVSWKVATDVNLENVVNSGTFTTDASRDYTVKVDVDGLAPGTTYYYGFQAMGIASLTGKTKTTPTGDAAQHLKFGVVSCSNFQAGFFNAYGRLAARNDLDAIIHLGDYIYEYADGVYGDSTLFEDRPLEPSTEIITLEEYRTRYSTYRLDTNLVRAHQQHPFIAVWDDHESANDSYVDGAENHNAGEGDWETRKGISKQVYFEWMPIRDEADQKVYRTFSYGNLMDLIMLDTRLEGREEQILDVNAPELLDPDRTLLGAEQKAWFFDQLNQSEAKWKVVGQQVIFSEFHVGWAGVGNPLGTYESLESIFLDIWDGYPAERDQVIDEVVGNEIDNVVLLTGDFHCTFAFDVPEKPIDVSLIDIPGQGTIPFYTTNPDYDPATGAGSKMVEFATPSITSANFDENLDALSALGLQLQINSEISSPLGSLGVPNPHMKAVDLIQHGYFILDIKPDSTQANWYFTNIETANDQEEYAFAWYTRDGENHLNGAPAESAPKAEQDIPAPATPPMTSNATEVAQVAILGVSPNPFAELTTLTFSTKEQLPVRVELLDAKGTLVKVLMEEELPAGLYTLRTDGTDLSAGIYFYQLTVGTQQKTVKVIRR